MSDTRSVVTFDAQLAAAARGVLAYPDSARLVVDGVIDVLGAEPLGVEDISGYRPGHHHHPVRPSRESGSPGFRLLLRGPRCRRPRPEFRSPAHLLNRGYLRRTVEHANQCHQPELRRAVGRRTGTPYGDIAAVTLADLRDDRVAVQWVDATDAHTRVQAFPFPARTPEELGRRLRRELDTRLC